MIIILSSQFLGQTLVTFNKVLSALVVRHLNIKEGMSLCVSEGVKDYEIVELPSGFLGDRT